MKKYLLLLTTFVAFCSCTTSTQSVVVSNATSIDRKAEILEIEVDDAASKVVFDSEGNEIPSQVTYEGNLIFPVTIAANSQAEYQLREGVPTEIDTLAIGRLYREREADIAWESDKIGFRIYSQQAAKGGKKLYGLDIFTKRGSKPVLDELYAMQCDGKTNATIKRLRAKGEKSAGMLANAHSYHVDHGKGMDYYVVGPTLGCGTAALCGDDTVYYPTYYKKFDVLDHGGLRYSFVVEFDPVDVNGEMVTERRTYSLDAGSHFNKVTVEYLNLTKPMKVIAGVVLHDNKSESAVQGKNYVAYAEPMHLYEWQTYNAVIFDNDMTPHLDLFDDEERADHGGAYGHNQAEGTYTPNKPLVYYAGAAWNRWGFETPKKWFDYVAQQSEAIMTPLTYQIK